VTKPIRTILCVPGHDLHKVERCRDFGADLILFDLEDSVPADKKALAREIVAAHARPGDAVRVEESIASAVAAWEGRSVAVWLPKLGQNVLDKASRLWGETGVGLVPIIETPAAVLSLLDPHLPAIAGLAFGRADFMAAVGARSTAAPLVDRAQEMVALAAHALGVPCYDSPCEERDPRQAAWEASRAVTCCYTGKGCVYPEHVEIVRSIFDPAPADVERARRIVARAEELGGALFVDNGKVVAPPHVKAAKELLAWR
jgi:citrate lyase beta subunit